LDNPRPTIQELKSVLYPKDEFRQLTTRNQSIRKGHVPDPDNPGNLKYDRKAYVNWLRSNAAKQQLLMKEIIQKHEEDNKERNVY
jgi:hypothetical protein